MKTYELTGRALDWAVGQVKFGPNGCPEHMLGREVAGWGHRKIKWQPSTRYDQGGHILDEHKIDTWWDADFSEWVAMPSEASPVADPSDVNSACSGPTRLIAGLRCVVANVYGDDIDVPEHLLTESDNAE